MTQIYFQRAPNKVENLRKFQGGGGLLQEPRIVYNGNSGGVGGGSKVNVPFVEGYGYILEIHNNRYDVLLARFLVANF